MLKSKYSFFGWTCLAAFAWGGLACAGETPTKPAPSSPPAAQTPAARLIPPIQALIGDATCDNSVQCHTIGVGAKPCGGPAGFLAWSSKDADEKTLRAAVARQAAASKDENLRSDMRSNCALEPDPGASCQAGRCVLNPRGLGGSSLAQ